MARELLQNGQIIQTLDPICSFPPRRITFIMPGSPKPDMQASFFSISSTGNFPFIVSLQIFSEIKGIFVHFCGGVLLQSDIVLTAAHCVQEILGGVRQFGKVRSDLKGGVFAALNPYCRHQPGDQDRIAVQDFIIHEHYLDWPELGYDIALIRLQAPFNYSGPYPTLETGDNLSNDTKAYLGGQGYVSAEEANKESTLYFEKATYMRMGQLNFVPEDQCRHQLIKDFDFDILSETMLCFKFPTNDTCKGDSGGPLIIYDYNNVSDGFIWRLIGLTSWGVQTDCNTRAKVGVYVKISSLLDWLIENEKLLSAAPMPTAPVQDSNATSDTAQIIGGRSISIGVGACIGVAMGSAGSARALPKFSKSLLNSNFLPTYLEFLAFEHYPNKTSTPQLKMPPTPMGACAVQPEVQRIGISIDFIDDDMEETCENRTGYYFNLDEQQCKEYMTCLLPLFNTLESCNNTCNQQSQ